MSDLLKDNPDYLYERLYWLKYHLWVIKNALNTNEIEPKELIALSQLSDAEIAAETKKPIKKPLTPFQKLNKIIQDGLNDDTGDVLFIECSTLDTELLTFDEAQSHYLSLAPLGTKNRETINLNLHDMASLGLVFAQYLDISSENNTHRLSLEKIESEHSRQQWIQDRPPRINSDFDPATMTASCLFEKLLTGTLSAREWLTDLDIEHVCQNLAKKKFPAAID